MEPDQFQQAWRAQSSQTRVTVDAELLQKEVQANQKAFQATILQRDIREVGVAAVLIPVWFYLGAWRTLPWTWYLTVPACIWVAGFMLVDRMRHPQQRSAPGEPLVQSVQVSLREVEHQIWLLRNIFWWYLLPFTVSILAFFTQVTWQVVNIVGLEALAGGALLFVFLGVIYSFLYWLNQYAVRKRLEPRRQELLTLLASLGNETSGENESERDAVTKSEASVNAPRNLGRTLAFVFVLAAITAVASVAAHFAGRAAAGYPKLSPFAAVRWAESQPEVRIGEEWFQLVALDDVPAAEIVAFSQRTNGDLWRKRFEEDLVELLSRMGHPPEEEAVDLTVRPLTSAETRVLEDVPMTAANRRAIRAATEARGDSGP